MEYLEHSGFEKYWIASRQMGFFDREYFETGLDFRKYLESSMLEVNVYYFFLRQGALVYCLKDLNNLRSGILIVIFFITC
jgi:hypothetical protein